MWPQTAPRRQYDHNISNNFGMESKTRNHIAPSYREEQVSNLWDGVMVWRGLFARGNEGGTHMVENKFR